MRELGEGEGPAGNGERLQCCALWVARDEKWSGRLGRAGAGVLHDAVGLARAPTARGLRAQVIGDGWHHTAVKI